MRSGPLVWVALLAAALVAMGNLVVFLLFRSEIGSSKKDAERIGF